MKGRVMVVVFFWFVIFQGFQSKDSGNYTDSRDEQRYSTVKINDQVWLSENFRYKIKGSWAYENDSENISRHGLLYTWKAARKACPPGWHLPTDEEWKELERYLQVPDRLLDKSDYRVPADTERFERFKTDFGLKMSGCRKHEDGQFLGMGWFSFFWTSTPHKKIYAWKRTFDKKEEGIGRHTFNKKNGCAVRYVKD